ncbi:MAG: LysR family transcriptional regulator, partial [Kiloniellales bacterium]|nr:LysR family transcriptional regulator [Kiloniellales bacterium]
MKPDDLDWDDLRIALAVAETGSLSAAARSLGLSHSTVLRRLSAFEAKIGVRLFERQPRGYAPTAAGLEARETARRMEAEM